MRVQPVTQRTSVFLKVRIADRLAPQTLRTGLRPPSPKSHYMPRDFINSPSGLIGGNNAFKLVLIETKLFNH